MLCNERGVMVPRCSDSEKQDIEEIKQSEKRKKNENEPGWRPFFKHLVHRYFVVSIVRQS